MDLVATFLDTLDLLFDLYAEPAAETESSAPPPPEMAESVPAETSAP
jgi:hypothetical protein